MKRKILLILLVCGLVTMVSAQAQGRGRTSSRIPAAEKVTVSGSLAVAHGMPALQSGDVTYLLGGISRFFGFIDGLKEGAQVTIEGSALTSPRDSNLKILRLSKLTMNGKSYDMALPEGGLGFYMPRFNYPVPPQGMMRPYGQRPEDLRPKGPRQPDRNRSSPYERRWQNSGPRDL